MGTTKEVFSELNLPHGEIEYLEFPEPKLNEDLKEYSSRMAEEIDDSNENILVGLSMGGFVAQEITRIRRIEKVILISSITNDHDWQKIMAWLRKLNVASFLPARIYKEAIVRLLPLAINKNQTKIDFVKMAKQFSANYFKFAVVQLSQWTEVECLAPIVQIHGDCDELFSIGAKKSKYIVRGGKHLMIATHANEISDFLKEELRYLA